MKKVYLLALLLQLKLAAAAQFNDSLHHYLNINLAGTLNNASGDRNYLLNNFIKYKYYKRKSELNFNSGWIYGKNKDGLTNNDFSTSVDFNIYRDTAARINYWGLAGYTSSYSLKINNQFQAGLGVAYKLVDTKHMYLRVSDGILFEHSNLLINDSIPDIYTTFRNSLRLQLRLFPVQRVSFDGTAFWQPSVKNIGDYIITTQMGLSIKLMKWLSLSTRLNYNRISRTDKENLLLTYGILIEQYF
ncbi:hypothetical protein A8C56_09895 [Niabella ginsenosidivorans]|uniref:DUF481 domain-containing protein n=1 Tax=Niabella ginsenosidivorans TaxID=1176587 RepID=A0A1A9I1P4_9BACT|nr:DUF481 domain-containing protein [Niabella ginsenosidivorans]ANH81255.1 hypothetical protein A8C56_09895 [Niabella ginsenosidivorans]